MTDERRDAAAREIRDEQRQAARGEAALVYGDPGQLERERAEVRRNAFPAR